MINGFSKKLEKMNRFEIENSKLLSYDLKRNYAGEYRTHSYIRIITIMHGELKLTIEGKESIQKKNEFVILPSYANAYVEVLKNTRALVLEISDTLIKEVYDAGGQVINFASAVNTPMQYYKEVYCEDIYYDINKIQQSFFKQKEDPYLIELYLKRLMFHLLKTEVGSHLFSIKAKHPMEQIAYYIKRKAMSNINLKEIAKKYGMSESNLSHTFKNHFGITPKSYLNAYRLELASEMLENETVTEVAYHLGYDNISNFIRQFKNKYQVTPKQYQLSLKVSL